MPKRKKTIFDCWPNVRNGVVLGVTSGVAIGVVTTFMAGGGRTSLASTMISRCSMSAGFFGSIFGLAGLIRCDEKQTLRLSDKIEFTQLRKTKNEEQ